MKGRKRHLNVIKPVVELPEPTSIERGVTSSDESENNSIYAERKELTIIDALDSIQQKAHMSKLSQEFWESWDTEVEYLCDILDLNKKQVVLIAILNEIGESLSWRYLGEFLGIFGCSDEQLEKPERTGTVRRSRLGHFKRLISATLTLKKSIPSSFNSFMIPTITVTMKQNTLLR